MSERELNLNSLDRYAKRSPEFALEEYGSCEVPAGCGGVVLRWTRRDRAQVQVSLSVRTRGEHETFLDGDPLPSSMTRLIVGRHVLGLRVAAPDLVQGFVLASLRALRRAERTLSATRADGTWRATVVPPAPGPANWATTQFDDSAWVPLVELDIPHGPRPAAGEPLGGERWNDYLHAELLDEGARPLGLPADRGATSRPATVWIRHVFEVTAP